MAKWLRKLAHVALAAPARPRREARAAATTRDPPATTRCHDPRPDPLHDPLPSHTAPLPLLRREGCASEIPQELLPVRAAGTDFDEVLGHGLDDEDAEGEHDEAKEDNAPDERLQGGGDACGWLHAPAGVSRRRTAWLDIGRHALMVQIGSECNPGWRRHVKEGGRSEVGRTSLAQASNQNGSLERARTVVYIHHHAPYACTSTTKMTAKRRPRKFPGLGHHLMLCDNELSTPHIARTTLREMHPKTTHN